MALTLHTMSGSPYGWRVWLALELKSVPYEIRTLSWDGGDFRAPGFAALNPRRRVPVIEHDGFVLYESAAIVEYVADNWPDGPPLFSPDLRQRAIERRMVREADQYFAAALEHLVQAVFYTPPEKREQARIDAIWADMREELALWESLIRGEFLAGDFSAADITLFPEIALGYRIAERNPGLVSGDLLGGRMATWYARMRALPLVRRTWPPHWAPPALE